MTTPIIAIVGKSNSGKTTLVEKIVALLTRKGYVIGTAKHTHCGFDIDREGKDTWRHRKAGAGATLMVTDDEAVLVRNDTRIPEAKMETYLAGMDLIIAEGFKSRDLPKIEVFRTGSNHSMPLFMDPELNVADTLAAFVTDSDYQAEVPVFGLDDADGVAELIENRFLKG